MSAPTLTTAKLRDLLSAELRGSDAVEINWLSTVTEAKPTDLTFARDTANARALAGSKAGAAIVTRSVIAEVNTPMSLLVVDDADRALITVLEAFADAATLDRPELGVHPSAIVHPSAKIGLGVAIGPMCVIAEGAQIGDGTALASNVTVGTNSTIGRACILRPGVVIETRCHIADGCTLHANVVVGSDGFGFRPAEDGQGLVKIPHIGGVRIGRGVEIGANSAIDRGKLGDTVIGDGTKIDNLVQIGHNCQIGRGCVLCGQVGLGGSVKLGDGVVMGGQAGARDNVTLGDGARLGGKSGAARSIPAGEGWAGMPAVPGRQYLRQTSILGRAELMFDELFTRLEAIEAERLK